MVRFNQLRDEGITTGNALKEACFIRQQHGILYLTDAGSHSGRLLAGDAWAGEMGAQKMAPIQALVLLVSGDHPDTCHHQPGAEQLQPRNIFTQKDAGKKNG